MSDRPAEVLKTLMRHEAGLLKAGKLSDVVSLLPERMRLSAAVVDGGLLAPDDLQGIVALARENESLLHAAIKGVRDVQARLSKRETGAGFRSYSSEGAISQIGERRTRTTRSY